MQYKIISVPCTNWINLCKCVEILVFHKLIQGVQFHLIMCDSSSLSNPSCSITTMLMLGWMDGFHIT